MSQTDVDERAPSSREKRDSRDEENAFALACFRTLGPAPGAESPLGSVRDWASATKVLERHGLLPILGVAAADASPSSSVPSNVRQLVLRNRLRLALYHANTLEALTDVTRELEAADIPHAVLKGAYLYERLYRDLFPREYGDTDLLVPASRMADAIVALNKAGYDAAMTRSGRSSMPRWHFHIVLVSRKPGGLPIELHRSLVDKANLYRVRDGELFLRLKEFQARQSRFTVLSAEDEFIYLCLHAAKHGSLNFIGLRGGYGADWFCGSATGNRLIWFLDIELFLRKEKDNLEWRTVAERVRDWNVSDDVRDCLRVLQLLMPSSQAGYAMERLGCHSPEGFSTPGAGDPGTSDSGAAPGRAPGVLARILRSGAGQGLLERSMRTHPMFLIRPIRLFLVWRSLVPSPARLLIYHGRRSRLWLPWLYLVHPFHVIRKMLVP